MHIYTHEELVQELAAAQIKSINLSRENINLRQQLISLQKESVEDFKLIIELVKQRDMLAESLKKHHNHIL